MAHPNTLSLAQTIGIDGLSAIITLLCLCSWQRLYVVCVILDGRVTEDWITICSYSGELLGSRWVIRIMCWWVLKFGWQTVIWLDCNLGSTAGWLQHLNNLQSFPSWQWLPALLKAAIGEASGKPPFTLWNDTSWYASHPDRHRKSDLLELLQKNHSVVSHNTQSGVCFHFTICTRKLYSDCLFDLHQFFWLTKKNKIIGFIILSDSVV